MHNQNVGINYQRPAKHHRNQSNLNTTTLRHSPLHPIKTRHLIRITFRSYQLYQSKKSTRGIGH